MRVDYSSAGRYLQHDQMKTPKTAKKAKATSRPETGTEKEAEYLFGSTIGKDHYTDAGEHPEDRIHRDREYIHRLRAHMDEVFGGLERDLGIKKDSNWLFDFVHNESRNIEFEDYLVEYGVRYEDIVDLGKRKGAGTGDERGGARTSGRRGK